MDFGFIITRHVKDKTTNEYWNRCVKSIRHFYPFKKIIIIDDNSKKEFVSSQETYDNVHVLNSIYKGRGELLPFLYLYKHSFFPNAVILHDSVFFQKRINFEKLYKFGVLPLWHFDYRENTNKCVEICSSLNFSEQIIDKLHYNPVQQFGFKPGDKWYGCFGVQCYIETDFLQRIQEKYKLNKLIPKITNRNERCCLERIMGIIFFLENNKLFQKPSLLGNIFNYQKWKYTYEEYKSKNNYSSLPLIKVFTGR